MPRKPAKSKRKKKVEGLSEPELQWLFRGWTLGGPWSNSNPMPEDRERHLWDQHKEEIMRLWNNPDQWTGSRFFTPDGPGTKPSVWWKFEARG